MLETREVASVIKGKLSADRPLRIMGGQNSVKNHLKSIPVIGPTLVSLARTPVVARARSHLAERRDRISLTVKWQMCRRGKPHDLPGPLVVSLTSFAPRFHTLALTLRCLLTQTVRPDHVILWVGHGDEPQLPKGVMALRRHGLDIRGTKDVRSYTKIIPALRAFPSAFIVTADDDLCYRRRWLEELVAGWDGRRNLIVCHRTHKITVDSNGYPLPYTRWVFDTKLRGEAIDLFPTTGYGALYPPGSLAPEVLDETTFLSICPRADDVWLYWMGRLAGSTFRRITDRREIRTWPNSQHIMLASYNVLEGGNDEQIRNMIAKFGWPNAELGKPAA